MENNEILPQGEIVLYQPDESIKLEVRLDATLETVWLTQQQMADLFGVKQPAISKHLNNIFASGELDKNSVHSILEYTAADGKVYKTQFYNLDAILSVGYRLNGAYAVAFRRWATGVLKNHLLQGYSVNRQLVALQERTDERFLMIENQLEKHEKQLDFFITTSTPPAEMVFFEGDFYKARVALENLVKTAQKRAIIIDAYVNALTLDILDVRSPGVEAVIFTSGAGEKMQRLMVEHDRLFPNDHIDIRKWRNESHDRWLIIDDRLYHCGHSLNANGGHKISAITLMGCEPEAILKEMR